MTSYYDGAAKDIIHQWPAPYSGIRMDVVEYKEMPGIVVLRFHADNLYSFSDSQLVSIAEWMNTLLKQLNSKPLLGKYTWECVEND